MNITKHARQRYVERIKGITDKLERDAYISINEEVIDSHINKMFQYAKHIYTGQIGTDKTTKKFYLNQDIAFVVSNDDAIVTIFRVDFAFPEKTKFNVINDLIEEILNGNIEVDGLKIEYDQNSKELDNELQINIQKIKQLKDEIILLEAKNDIIKSQKDIGLKEVQVVNSKIRGYAEQLFGNTSYKEDLSNWR